MSQHHTANSQGFGTFKGVFTPSILTIFGVIMFLRLGWVLGHVGLLASLLIVTLASAITFITGLSIAATATNMRVGGGGAYYMISRSLGIEAGAAIGIPLYFAQAFGIAFYLAGFSESAAVFFPSIPMPLLSTIALFILTLFAYVSANFALRIQFFIFALIFAAIGSFFWGRQGSLEMEWLATAIDAQPSQKMGFWPVFAVFFPAVTGIEAGLSMSGDLKHPAKSLPLGTLSAVVVGFVVYLAIPIVMSLRFADHPAALFHPSAFEAASRWPTLVQWGVFGASLSSALGALLGAPRTLQALSKDRVLWKKFAGVPENASPKLATLVTFVVAIGGIWLGDLNTIAPILSMFFLTSYGMLNLSAAMESFISNPSWRPSFSTPWAVSAAGAFGCFSVMFMIDAGATIVSLTLTFGVYYMMQRRKMRAYWGDMRRGILAYLAKYSMEKLALLPENMKSWRPNVLVLSGAPTKRWYLVELGHAIASRSGFLTIATIIPPGSQAENKIVKKQNSIEGFLRGKEVNAFVRVSVSENILHGAVNLVRDYGLGPICPNTVILGETEQSENFEAFASMIIRLYQAKRNIVIIRLPNSANIDSDVGLRHDAPMSRPIEHRGAIDVWWGRERSNAGLALALGYLIQSHTTWEQAELNLKSISCEKEEVKSGRELLNRFVGESRLDANWHMVYHDGPQETIFERIKAESKQANLIFIGMLPPDLDAFEVEPEQITKAYAEYYRGLLRKTDGFPPLAMTIAAEEMDFHKIFVPE
ncbi:MAG: Na-K-Cl cotransporter [Zetaproteobacteria bacterium]|nr:Na-K-Cl cotransporter [Zetaproteobacteria bacterium]